MKILALDSSGLVASAAVLEDDILLGEYTINHKKTHSQTLLPMVDALVQMLELDLNTVDAIAVAAGPGSFTGLRIGAATAKGLGLALDKPLIAVPTVDALAYNVGVTDCLICPMMDARRGQVYTGIYCYTEGKLDVLRPQEAVSVAELAETLNELGQEVILLGDGVPVYLERLKELLEVSYVVAPAHMSRQRAGAVGALAQLYYRKGKCQPAAEMAPEYLRKSQAEREREEREAREENKKEQETESRKEKRGEDGGKEDQETCVMEEKAGEGHEK